MSFIRGSDLKALAAQIENEDILHIEINEVTGKVEIGLVTPEDLQGSCSSCETCETPCSEKQV